MSRRGLDEIGAVDVVKLLACGHDAAHAILVDKRADLAADAFDIVPVRGRAAKELCADGGGGIAMGGGCGCGCGCGRGSGRGRGRGRAADATATAPAQGVCDALDAAVLADGSDEVAAAERRHVCQARDAA